MSFTPFRTVLRLLCLSLCLSASLRAGGAWAAVDTAPAEAAEASVRLLYREQEPGVDPYEVRMLVTHDFVRSDDGQADSDFLLYDRRQRTLYNVVHDDRTILVIPERDVELTAPASLRLTEQLQAEPDAPRIAGRPVSSFTLTANGESCRAGMVVPGLLPDATRALIEMEQVLARQQIATLYKTPPEFRTPCFLANYLYATDRLLRRGLPIQDGIRGGRQRLLIDFDPDYRAGKDLFRLPDGYRRYSID